MKAGTTLGHYTILEPLGKGGMGEVYLARDDKLKREVAVKVLPETVARDEERLKRFEREARVLAALNHPNIATVHDFASSEDVHFLVMELASGRTLADRIAEGPIPLSEALPLFTQIAEGLAAAHGSGIVHRDLKPANVQVDDDGNVKILDFGLARALDDDDAEGGDVSQSPTLTRGTAAGTILGTAAYMSPEQARGKKVDARTDVWAFGCCLYEALTGRQAFGGESVTDILAAIVAREPDWSALPPSTPSSIRRVLRRCLDKDKKRRLHHVADARLELAEPSEEAERPPTKKGSARPAYATFAAAVAALLVGGAAAWLLKPSPPPPPAFVRHFEWPVDELQQVVISPDGARLAYTAGGRLWIRDLSGPTAQEIPDTVGATDPFWSPDSAFVGYRLNRTSLWRVPAEGGVGAPIAQWGRGPMFSPQWGADGRIVFSSGPGNPSPDWTVYRVSARGGDPEAVSKPDGTELTGIGLQMLPDGQTLLLTTAIETDPETVAAVSEPLREHARRGLGESNPCRRRRGEALSLRHRRVLGRARPPRRGPPRRFQLRFRLRAVRAPAVPKPPPVPEGEPLGRRVRRGEPDGDRRAVSRGDLEHWVRVFRTTGRSSISACRRPGRWSSSCGSTAPGASRT